MNRTLTPTSGPSYVGGSGGCLHGYNVIGDWQYLTHDQRVEKLQEVRNNTKFAEPVIATPAAEMVRAYLNSESIAWDEAGADFLYACADTGYLTRKTQ